MGGSGGSFGSGYNPRDIAKEVRETEKRVQGEALNAELAGLLTELLGEINNRDTGLVEQRLEKIVEELAGIANGKLDLLFGGSVSKRTYVEGLSDIDCLLIVNDTTLEEAGPHAAIEQVATELQAQLGDEAEVTTGRLAVTVRYAEDGMEIQLLPAVRTAVGLKIPSSRIEGKWSEIDPTKFQQGLTKYNKACDKKLVPTIKLAKAIIGRLPDEHQLSGYHIESLAIAAFHDYTGSMTTAAMLPHFFERAKERVLKPMTDSSGQSVHVDDYMGETNSEMRTNASHILGRIAKRMANATASSSLPQWKDLLGVDE
jgi:hypothetical protein